MLPHGFEDCKIPKNNSNIKIESIRSSPSFKNGNNTNSPSFKPDKVSNNILSIKKNNLLDVESLKSISSS